MQWCDVDVIHPTPPTGIFEHPERTHDFFKTGSIKFYLILLMLINKVPQQEGEGGVLVETIRQAHPTRYSLSVAEDIPVYVSLSILLITVRLLQRLLTLVSLILWRVLLKVGEGALVRGPILIAVESPLGKCLN